MVFSPTDINGCTLWIDGDHASSGFATDLSGSSHGYVAVVPPSITTGPNGHSAIDFTYDGAPVLGSNSTYYEPSTTFYPWDLFEANTSTTFGWTVFAVFNMKSGNDLTSDSRDDHLSYMAAEAAELGFTTAFGPLPNDNCFGIRLAAPYVVTQFGEVESGDIATESTVHLLRVQGNQYVAAGAGDLQISAGVAVGSWDIAMIRFSRSTLNDAPANRPTIRTGLFPTPVSGLRDNPATFVNPGLLGADPTDGSAFIGYGCDSKVAEIIVWNEHLTCRQRNMVGRYLSEKYALPYTPEICTGGGTGFVHGTIF